MTDCSLAPQLDAVADWVVATPLPTPTPPVPLWSQTFAIMENNDPYDWDNDQVIRELCTGDKTWTPQSGSRSLDLQEFTRRLRKHEVDGACLLTGIEEPELKQELGLELLMHRSYVRNAIRTLRTKSVKYNEYHGKSAGSNMDAALSNLQDTARNFADVMSRISGSVAANGNGRGSINDADDDEPASKRTKLESAVVDEILIVQSLNDIADPSRATNGDIVQMRQSEEQLHTPSTEKKRKRIAPTLVSTELDLSRNRVIPSAADYVHPEPGVLFVDAVGRKRLVPMLQKATGYLGAKSLPVDGLFFVETSYASFDLTSEDEKPSEFVHVRRDHLAGQQQYVHHRMRHFLQSEHISFRRGNDEFIAVKPYPKALLPKFQPASFTLFSLASGVVTVNKEHMQNWPEVNETADEVDPDPEPALSGLAGLSLQLNGSYDNWDPEIDLQKYANLEGDKLLPLYGDSDSDNEYDDATWREIEEERGILDKGPLRQSRRTPLDQASVNEAIEEGINQHITKWNLKDLPKLDRSAWKFWMKSRKRNSKHEQIKALQMDLSHINQRLEKLKDEILLTPWSSKLQVVKQTTSLEGTVFDQQTLQWRLSTLQSKVPPARSETSFEEMQAENVVADDSQSAQDLPDDELLESQDEQSSDENGLEDCIYTDASDDELDIDDELIDLSTQSDDDDDVVIGDESPAISPRQKSPVEVYATPVKKPKLIDTTVDDHPQDAATQIKNETSRAQRAAFEQGEREVISLLSSSDEVTPTKLTTKMPGIASQGRLSPSYLVNPDGSINLITPEKPKLSIKEAMYFNQHGESPPKARGPLFGCVPNSVSNFEDSDDDDEPLAANRRRPRKSIASDGTEEDDASPEEEVPRRGRKKLVENEDAKGMRARDILRRRDEEARRAVLHARLSQLEPGDDEHDKVIVNDAASAPPYLYLNEHIAQRIKKHQVTGVRFLWHTVIQENQEIQGCLLAHTMGLGKTMQSIALLVSIAEASLSDDPLMVETIPESLRSTKTRPIKTLILCPPTLINNWMDELITWVKPSYLLGDLRKVDASLKPPARLETITTWHENGGVLIMGYQMFRRYVVNKANNKGKQPYSEDVHERLMQELVQGPNIVIADEAHMMKDSRTDLTISAQKFDTRCRIALTGSPLANNIMEYHTMIEWVAPNYLGPSKEFKRKYAEPIQTGLYTDSEPFERRRALKMLNVLEKDIDPKVQRATMSVLKHDLKQKTEFTITVALTDLQREAYILYVRAMLGSSSNTTMTKDGEIPQATLWSWLGLLTLLCNHPLPFKEKLAVRMDDAIKEYAALKSKEQTDSDATPSADDTPFDVNAPVKGVSQALIDAETKLFEKTVDITDFTLSNKTKILCQILDAAAAAKDKTLVFSQSIPTLNYLEELFNIQGRQFYRLDGATKVDNRQAYTKAFNKETNATNIFLISTTAGGLGLNLQSANRVVIFDFKFNPIQEEQAIGRAYRIGQKKETFVYRFIAGGTFESNVHNKTIFKQQLANRVVDKKSHKSMANRKLADFLFEPKAVKLQDLSEFEDVDKLVLDKVLELQDNERTICSIVQSDIFEKDDDEKLTAEEQAEVERWHLQEKDRRTFGVSTANASELRDYNPHRAALNAAIYTPSHVAAPLPRFALSPTGAIVPPLQATPVFAPHANFPASVVNLNWNRSQRGSSPLLGGSTSISNPPAHLSTPSGIRRISSTKSGITVAEPKSNGSPNRRYAVLPPPLRNRVVSSKSSPLTSSATEKVSGKTSIQKTQDALDRQESASMKTVSVGERGTKSPEEVRSPRGSLMAQFGNPTSSRAPSEAGTSSRQRIEAISRRSSTISNGIADLKNTDMFKAMDRMLAVQSLKTPVVQKLKNRQRRFGEQDHQRSHSRPSPVINPPRSRGMNNTRASNVRSNRSDTDPPRSTPSSSSSNIANLAGPLPGWAREKLNKQGAETAPSRETLRDSSSRK